MKRLLIPIILAAILGIGGVIAAVIINQPDVNREEVYSEPPAEELKVASGKYYLSGDKNSGIWMEVNPDFLTLKGDDVDGFLLSYAQKKYQHYENADEAIKSLYEDLKLIYCGEKRYSVEFRADTLYAIKVSRNGGNATFADPRDSKATFYYYKDENRIHCSSSIDDFILVED